MTANPVRIAVIGANPAFQKTLLFDQLTFGEVNRARELHTYASGKGLNFVHAAHRCQAECVLMQFAGGVTGKLITAELVSQQINHRTIQVAATTRTCTTCIDQATSEMTELIEPSGEVKPTEEEAFFAALPKIISTVDAVSICGTCPPGVSGDFYSKIINCARQFSGKQILLDAYLNIVPALETGVDILKVNSSEVKKIAQSDNIITAIKKIISLYPVKAVAVTDGAYQAFLGTETVTYRFTIPEINDLKSPLGAGDTASAVLFTKYLQGDLLTTAFSAALAAASDSCRSFFCADYSPERARQLQQEIAITLING